MGSAERSSMNNRKIAVGLLFILVVLIGVIFYLVLSKDRYEREGDELMGEYKYEQALDKYIRSMRRTTFFTDKGRVIYKIGQAYEMRGDEPRAMDFYYQILRDEKDSPWMVKAERRLQAIHGKVEAPRLTVGSTPLVKAYSQFNYRYKLLMSEIKKNRSGVSGRLKEAYEEYVQSYRAYNKMVAVQYPKAVARQKERARKRAVAMAGAAESFEEE